MTEPQKAAHSPNILPSYTGAIGARISVIHGKKESEISCQNSVKICHLETLMRESPRSPALLAQFISKENAQNSHPGVFQRRLRGDSGEAEPIRSHLRRVFSEAPMMSHGDSFVCLFVCPFFFFFPLLLFFFFLYFSYCATCPWSEESLQKLQWSERSEFGVQ